MSLAAFGEKQAGVLQLHPHLTVKHFDGITLEDIDFNAHFDPEDESQGSGRTNSEAPKGSGRAENPEAPKGSGRANSEAPKGSRRANSEPQKGSGRAENPIFNTNCTRIIDVDASQVEQCDSVGIAALLWLFQQASAQQICLQLIHLPLKMQQLLELYELHFLKDPANYARRTD